MQGIVEQNLEHIMCAAILAARAADTGTTLFATPRFKLEANPLVRQYRVPMILASLGLCLVPYLSVDGGLIILVISLLVTVSNSLRLWLVTALGEDTYYQILLDAAARANPRLSVALNILPGLVMMLLALILFLYYPDPTKDHGFYFAFGMFTYGVMVAVNYPRSFLRARREAQARVRPDGVADLTE